MEHPPSHIERSTGRSTTNGRTGGTWAVLPVKPFEAAKSRLDGALAPEERAALAKRLMLGCLRALSQSGCFDRVMVVSRDPDALAIAGEHCAHPLGEGTLPGLNPALVTAREPALAAGAARLLILASDLPLVQPEDVRDVIAASRGADAVIVPDRDERGTNALLLSPPDLIEPAFGPGSFQRHLRLLRRAGAGVEVLRLERIAFDFDLPRDLAELETAGLKPQPG